MAGVVCLEGDDDKAALWKEYDVAAGRIVGLGFELRVWGPRLERLVENGKVVAVGVNLHDANSSAGSVVNDSSLHAEEMRDDLPGGDWCSRRRRR